MSDAKSGNLPLYLFHQGTNCEAYRFLGAHPEIRDGQAGYIFRTWAPAAASVSVVGTFNDWEPEAAPMDKISDGVYELFLPGVQQYDTYKYCVRGADGRERYKCDPYAFHAETRPANASKLYDLSGYEWSDDAWVNRRDADPYHAPVNIYELHAGSWQRNEDGSFLSYRMLADRLAAYLPDMGYTHVELMPISEYPFDG